MEIDNIAQNLFMSYSLKKEWIDFLIKFQNGWKRNIGKDKFF